MLMVRELTDDEIQAEVGKHFGVFNHKPKKGRPQEPALLAGNMSHAVNLVRACIEAARIQQTERD